MPIYKEQKRGEKVLMVQFYEDGHRRRFSSNPETGKPFETLREAKAFESRLLAKSYEPKQKRRTRCKDLKKQFFSSIERRCKPSTLYCRENFYENYLASEFEQYFVEDLTNDDLDRINDRFNVKASRGTMINVMSVARTYIKFLRKWNGSLLPERFYAYRDSSPKVHIYHFYTFEEEKRFLSVIDDPRDKLLFSLFCHYGFRLTEALGLKYGDIDFEKDTISISRIVVVKNVLKKQIFTTPKTKRSIRTLALIPEVRSLVKKGKDPNAFIFPSSKEGSEVMGEISVRRKARKYALKANLTPIKVHEFRHSCASNLIKEGFPLRVVARWLGDTEGTILHYYSHMFPDEADSISGFFKNNPLEVH